MDSETPELGQLLLLGRDHGDWGQITSTPVGSLAAAAITVGSDPESPSSQFKYDPDVSNEDVGCITSYLEWTGLAVADAHYGPESSHMLIERLHTVWANVRPTGVDHLAQMIESLGHGDPAVTESETTFIAAVYDRPTRTGFGISFGDSTFAIAGPNRSAVPVNSHDHRFVNTIRPESLRNGSAFKFRAGPGDLLVMFTDGIDGCHYRHPKTSIQPTDIDQVMSNADYDPHRCVKNLAQLGLDGVRGNPGGQDNIVVLAATA